MDRMMDYTTCFVACNTYMACQINAYYALIATLYVLSVIISGSQCDPTVCCSVQMMKVYLFTEMWVGGKKKDA